MLDVLRSYAGHHAFQVLRMYIYSYSTWDKLLRSNRWHTRVVAFEAREKPLPEGSWSTKPLLEDPNLDWVIIRFRRPIVVGRIPADIAAS